MDLIPLIDRKNHFWMFLFLKYIGLIILYYNVNIIISIYDVELIKGKSLWNNNQLFFLII